MPSQPKWGSVKSSGGGRFVSSEPAEVPVVEIDATFARLMGLVDSQKVDCFLHSNSNDEL